MTRVGARKHNAAARNHIALGYSKFSKVKVEKSTGNTARKRKNAARQKPGLTYHGARAGGCGPITARPVFDMTPLIAIARGGVNRGFGKAPAGGSKKRNGRDCKRDRRAWQFRSTEKSSGPSNRN